MQQRLGRKRTDRLYDVGCGGQQTSETAAERLKRAAAWWRGSLLQRNAAGQVVEARSAAPEERRGEDPNSSLHAATKEIDRRASTAAALTNCHYRSQRMSHVRPMQRWTQDCWT